MISIVKSTLVLEIDKCAQNKTKMFIERRESIYKKCQLELSFSSNN